MAEPHWGVAVETQSDHAADSANTPLFATLGGHAFGPTLAFLNAQAGMIPAEGRVELMQMEVASFAKHFKLSPREAEIMGLLVRRVTTFKRIAERIGSSPHTVRNQVRSIFSKTHTDNKCDLLGLFVQGLITQDLDGFGPYSDDRPPVEAMPEP